jgi:hypothetical protein
MHPVFFKLMFLILGDSALSRLRFSSWLPGRRAFLDCHLRNVGGGAPGVLSFG